MTTSGEGSQANFQAFEFCMSHSQDLVKVGVIRTHSEATRFPDGFLEQVERRVRHEGVRILAGVFGDTKSEMENLCRSCGAKGKRALCQPWLKDGQLCVHPSYIFIFGPCKD